MWQWNKTRSKVKRFGLWIHCAGRKVCCLNSANTYLILCKGSPMNNHGYSMQVVDEQDPSMSRHKSSVPNKAANQLLNRWKSYCVLKIITNIHVVMKLKSSQRASVMFSVCAAGASTSNLARKKLTTCPLSGSPCAKAHPHDCTSSQRAAVSM